MAQPLATVLDIKAPAQDSEPSRRKARLPLFAIILALICGASLWLRAPLVDSGLPYLYEEDEGHHFNRVVQMTKSGDFHPHYFLKPALHFYLRMPITGLAFLKGVEKGHLRELSEIKTRNKYGMGGYEWTASHPILVKYNRAFSLLIALGAIVLCAIAGYQIGGPLVGILSGVFLAALPLHYQYSTHIGVDMLMTFFVVASLSTAIRYIKHGELLFICLSAACAGLAVASKYNAFWVALIPLFALLKPFRPGRLLVLGLIPLCFLLGAPYTVLDFPAFLDGAAYEVWHYKHSHPAEAGLPQALFYSSFLSESAFALCITALLGTVVALLGLPFRVTALLLAFPTAYFTYMSSQQLNFTRNMLVMLPFISLFAAYGLGRLTALTKAFSIPLAIAVSIGLIWQPASLSAALRDEAQMIPDSRNALRTRLSQAPRGSVAVAGELLLPHDLRTWQFSSKSFSKRKLAHLWNKGYATIVLPDHVLDASPEGEIIAGEKGEQRIVKNPQIRILRDSDSLQALSVEALRQKTPTSSASFDPRSSEGFGFGWGDTEDDGIRAYRWTKGRYASYSLESSGRGNRIRLNAFSPWKDQILEVYVDRQKVGRIKLKDRAWSSYTLPLHVSPKATTEIELLASQAGVPKSRGVSPDQRHLGVAIAKLSL